jgi:hypothetical protein
MNAYSNVMQASIIENAQPAAVAQPAPVINPPAE